MSDSTALQPTGTDTHLTWKSIDLDLNLGRHWFLLISADRNESDADDNDQFYTSLTYRF
jgi:hypothetical protein